MKKNNYRFDFCYQADSSLKEVKNLSLPFSYLIGIDEAGRGALAGRLAVAGVILPADKIYLIKDGIFNRDKFLPLRDSKKLSSSQRKDWFLWIKKQKEIIFSVSFVSPQKIDKLNIGKACNRAALKLLKNLLKKIKKGKKDGKVLIITDGGIQIKLKDLKEKRILALLSFPKADEKISAVSLASIVAKVLRDKEMEKNHLLYPNYYFFNNKGYGTRKHFQALKKIGPSKIHRRSFLRELFKFSFEI